MPRSQYQRRRWLPSSVFSSTVRQQLPKSLPRDWMRTDAPIDRTFSENVVQRFHFAFSLLITILSIIF
jgi:hypothetical protein